MLPEVPHAAGIWSRWKINHNRAGAREIYKTDDIRRRGVGSQDAQFVAKRLIDDNVTVDCAKRLVVGALKGGDANERQAPDIRLARALEVQFIVKFCNRVFGG